MDGMGRSFNGSYQEYALLPLLWTLGRGEHPATP